LWPSPPLGYSRLGGRPISELDEASISSALRRLVVEYDLDCNAPIGFVSGFAFEFGFFFMTSGALSLASASRSRIYTVKVS
jgi:hypothetical protein